MTIHAPTLAGSLAIPNSIAVNGCCLTIVSLENDRFSADLSGETVRKTSFGAGAAGLRQGTRVNLEHRDVAVMGGERGNKMRNDVDGGWTGILELFRTEAEKHQE